MKGTLLEKYLELIKNDINRKTLVTIACKIKIPGYTNHFNRPYIRKNELKKMIYNSLKNNHLKRSRSVSHIGGGRQKVNYIRRSKSLNNLTQHEFRKLSDINGDVLKSIGTHTKMLPKVPRIVAIGDLHGDLRATIRSLKLAGVIPLSTPENTNIKNIPWIGGNTVIVQLGDQIDRVRPTHWENDIVQDEIKNDEGSDLKIINLMDLLNVRAKKEGGAVLSVLGNHELMNVDGDFRYVSLDEFSEFGDMFSKNKQDYKNEKYPYGYKERLAVFKPGGILARRLALTRDSVVQVGSWLFVHGGLTPKLVDKYTLDEINMYIREWLKNNQSQRVEDVVDDIFRNDDDDFSPFWSRVFSDHDEWNESRNLYLFNNTINIINKRNGRNRNNYVKGMILGHTPQYMWNKGINSSFDNRLWRVDVGMSRAFGDLNKNRECRKVQVLEIINDNQFRILTEK
tara:strand:+ start:3973 stop:5334 length:1362 start_codon:yes stop_codon:yes gene_type:complete